MTFLISNILIFFLLQNFLMNVILTLNVKKYLSVSLNCFRVVNSTNVFVTLLVLPEKFEVQDQREWQNFLYGRPTS
jgi:hypothetical protein